MKIDTVAYRQGYEYTRGVLSAIGEACFVIFVVTCFMASLYVLAGWGLDDADKDSFERSGMTLLKDYGTGQEYLYKDGCIIERKKVTNESSGLHKRDSDVPTRSKGTASPGD